MTTHTPLRCANSTMFQRGSNEVVLFDTGNYPSFNSYLNQTWTWNGTDWTNASGVSFLDPNGPLPGRNGHVMTYDGTNVMLFGGQSGSSAGGVLNDTWTWNGTAWTKQAPATSPFGRYDAQAAHVTAGTVMFGGFGGAGNGVYLNETWLWNGSTWSQVSFANGASPSARIQHVMASNGTTNIYMFGGVNSAGQFLNDTWSFIGGVWTLLSPATSPSARGNACFAYDSVNSIYVLFGGVNEYNYLPETWTFNGTTWTQVSVANGAGPAGRSGAQMCFDTQSGKTILFGGVDGSTNYPSNSTWAFNGATLTWAKL